MTEVIFLSIFSVCSMVIQKQNKDLHSLMSLDTFLTVQHSIKNRCQTAFLSES